MASQINASNSGFGGIVSTGDSSGVLELQTTGTTAVTIDTSQRVGFVAGTAAAPAITRTGDTNTGMFFPAADTIAFAEGGTEAMRLDSSGNVGIGNAIPSSFDPAARNLVIGSGTGNQGTTIYAGSSSAGSIYFANGSSGTNLYKGYIGYIHSSDAMQFATNNSERMRIDSSGRVTTPYQPFCFATPPTSYAISGGTDTTIGGTWITVNNIGSHFNTSGGVFTAPVAGVYLAMWSLFFSANTGNRFDVYISVNGSPISRAEQQKWGTNNVNNTSFISTAYKLNANDTITFGAYCSTSTSTYSSAVPWSYAAVYLLG